MSLALLPEPLIRVLKKMMPRGLFGRTLLIIVTPTFLALAVATFVFFDRHWYSVTTRMTGAAAGDVAFIVDLLEKTRDPETKVDLIRMADRRMGLYISFEPGVKADPDDESWGSPLHGLMLRALRERVDVPVSVDMRSAAEMASVRVEVPSGSYVLLLPMRRIYTPTTEVFIGWMVGSSILLSLIALLFMRNQVRPIRRLADAAEAIGKGQDVPWFKPEGAIEVRQAGTSLIVMHDRLRRQIAQRTAMLAGVSHDLRTPLTRMKLQLALMPDTHETRGFQTDIDDMESMVEAYLSFARGEGAEPVVQEDLGAFLQEIADGAKRQRGNIHLRPFESLSLRMRKQSLKRCMANLVGNALRYAKHVEISVAVRERAIDIFVDDDGPGVPQNERESVFRPFLRLDESRNLDTGGVGLGLTIARDSARSHGGDIVLESSPMGGLRAHLWLPL